MMRTRAELAGESHEIMIAALEIEADREHHVRTVECRLCLAQSGQPCRELDKWRRVRPMSHGHTKRYNAAARAGVVPAIM
jgi:hypothetical protein